MSERAWTRWDYLDWTTYKLFQCLPVSLALGVAPLIGKSYFALGELRGQLWVARLRDTISRVLGVDDSKTLRALQYDAVANIARTGCEFALTERLLSSSRVTLSGISNISDKTGPYIFVGTHLGNWEFMIHALVRNGFDVTGLYDPPDTPARWKIASETRGRTLDKFPKTKMVATNSNVARELVRSIDRGGNLWIAIDEFKNGLVWGPKFGRKLPYLGNRMLAARLSVRAEALVVPIRSRRLPGSRIEVMVHEPIAMPNLVDEREKARALADEMSRIIEAWIKEDLTQWYYLPELRFERTFPGLREA